MPTVDLESVFDRLSGLPIRTFGEGECVLPQGGRTGQLLFLLQGAVDVVKDGWHIACITKPGAVFGDMAVILGRPHSADVRAAEPTRCHVIEDAAAALGAEPLLALYVMTVLASRLDAVNGHLIDARQRLGEDGPHSGFLAETLEHIGRAMRIGLPV